MLHRSRRKIFGNRFGGAIPTALARLSGVGGACALSIGAAVSLLMRTHKNETREEDEEDDDEEESSKLRARSLVEHEDGEIPKDTNHFACPLAPEVSPWALTSGCLPDNYCAVGPLDPTRRLPPQPPQLPPPPPPLLAVAPLAAMEVDLPHCAGCARLPPTPAATTPPQGQPSSDGPPPPLAISQAVLGAIFLSCGVLAATLAVCRRRRHLHSYMQTTARGSKRVQCADLEEEQDQLGTKKTEDQQQQ
jgi:hypothetical protein